MLEKLKNRDHYAAKLEKKLEDRRLQLEHQEQQQRSVTKALGQLDGTGRIEEQIKVQMQLANISATVINLNGQISAIEKELEKASSVEGVEEAKKRLVEQGKEAKKARDQYEKNWHQIHAYLEKNARLMVQAYENWYQISHEFWDLLVDLEPRARVGGDGFEAKLLRERAMSTLDELKKAGVDLATVLNWSDIHAIKSFPITILDGPYLGAMDKAHEVAQYGVELWPRVRSRYGIKHTIGAVASKHIAKSKMRPVFPVSDRVKDNIAGLKAAVNYEE